MINIAIYDDKWEWITQMESLVRKFFIALAEPVEIQLFLTGEELERQLESGDYFD